MISETVVKSLEILSHVGLGVDQTLAGKCSRLSGSGFRLDGFPFIRKEMST